MLFSSYKFLNLNAIFGAKLLKKKKKILGQIISLTLKIAKQLYEEIIPKLNKGLLDIRLSSPSAKRRVGFSPPFSLCLQTPPGLEITEMETHLRGLAWTPSFHSFHWLPGGEQNITWATSLKAATWEAKATLHLYHKCKSYLLKIKMSSSYNYNKVLQSF